MYGSNWARVSFLAGLCLLFPETGAARGTIDLTRDLNENPAPADKAGAGAARPVAIGGQLFFAGRDAEHGVELWASDGTEAGTRLVRDIQPGAAGSFPERFLDVGGIAYFVADDGTHGGELWRSDGTAGGTWMVRDIMRGHAESDTWNLIELNGILLFNADDGIAASELWRSDGTKAGTFLVKDIWPGPEHGGPQKMLRVGDLVYFVAMDAAHGKELWVTDGTGSGTRRVTDINPGPADSIFCRRAQPLVELGGEVFFSADDGVHGYELWKTDGTANGTTLVRDILPGPDSSNALPMLEAGGYVYLNAGLQRGELWVSDGTEAGTRRISENVWNRRGMIAAAGERVFFIGNPEQRASKGHQLWITDGTAAGTELLADVLTTVGVCQPRHFIRDLHAVGDRVYFAARTTGGDEELWTSDGTSAGTRKVVDVVAEGGCDPRDFASLDGIVYYVADDQVAGAELWRSDGTAEGTWLVRDNFASTDDFALRGELVPFRDEVLFAGTTGLFRSDGTGSGTHVISGTESITIASNVVSRSAIVATSEQALFWSVEPGGAALWRLADPSQAPERVEDFPGTRSVGAVALGDDVFFVTTYDRGGRLWRTDGSEIEDVFDFTPEGLDISERLFATDDLVFFTAFDSENSWELWRTDGTEAGTFMTRDNNRFGPGLNFQFVNPAGDLLYFTGNDGMNGWEMWRSDGTEAGTFMLADIDPGSLSGASYVPERAVTDSGRLIFVRNQESDEDGNERPDEIWTSDGTSEGTRLVTPLPGSGSRDEGMFAIGDVAYFSVYNQGRQLWRTDATRAGTYPVWRDSLREFTATGRAVYFTTFSRSVPGGTSTLWVTDGTPSGTQRLGQVAGDFLTMQLSTLVDAEGKLFLFGDDGVHGFEVLTASCGNGRIDGDEQCDQGDANGAGSCSVACVRQSTGDRVFAPLKRRGEGPPPPTRRLVGGRTGRTFVPSR